MSSSHGCLIRLFGATGKKNEKNCFVKPEANTIPAYSNKLRMVMISLVISYGNFDRKEKGKNSTFNSFYIGHFGDPCLTDEFKRYKLFHSNKFMFCTFR